LELVFSPDSDWKLSFDLSVDNSICLEIQFLIGAVLKESIHYLGEHFSERGLDVRGSGLSGLEILMM